MSKSLTRAEAHEVVDAAEQMGALAHLAAHWELPGHWNENAEYWNAACFHEYVDEMAESMQDRRASGRNPKDSDRTGLVAWEGVL